MRRFFVRDEGGQDMIEYTLLISFIVIVAAALLLVSQQPISTIWTVANTDLSKAQTTVGL
jgi:Flp pilus assembly pilin Flp